MTKSERCELAAEVFDAVFNATEKFGEQNIGRDLAYLMGAIVDHEHPDDSFVDWSTETYGPERPALLKILEDKFLIGHPVWKFIVIAFLEGDKK